MYTYCMSVYTYCMSVYAYYMSVYTYASSLCRTYDVHVYVLYVSRIHIVHMATFNVFRYAHVYVLYVCINMQVKYIG